MDRHATHPIVVDDVSVEYVGKRKRQFEALKGVSLTVERGELLGVIGESGSGKSALAQVVGAVTRHGHDTWPIVTHGSLTVLGEELRRVHERKLESLRLHIGYLPQDAATRLIPHLNVAENVAEPILSRDRRFNRRELGQRIAIMLDAVHLPLSTMTKAPWELSSGQQQRVAIARSLILEPAVWVADEPTTGIDITVRDTVAELIARLRAEREFSALIISHDLAVFSKLTSKVAVLYKGELVGYGPIDEVLANPIHPYVKGLAVNRAEASPRPRSRH